MKKCEYCGKEISYMEQYCCESCEKKAVDFYYMREKNTKIFSLVNGVCVMAIPIGIFASTLYASLGHIVIIAALLILGVTDTLLPFPVDNMISSMKLKKAILVTRLIGLAILLAGIVFLVLKIFVL